MLPTPRPPFPLSKTAREFCATITSSAPVYVDVRPPPWAIRRECFPNVKRQVNESGGTIIYGWAIWQCAHYFIEAVHHAVYRAREEQPLLDLTPNDPVVGRTLFLPDEDATYDFATLKKRDNVRLPLVASVRVKRLLDLFAARTALLNTVSRVSPPSARVEGATIRALQAIERETKALSDELASEWAMNISKTG